MRDHLRPTGPQNSSNTIKQENGNRMQTKLIRKDFAYLRSHWHSKTLENSCPRSHWHSKTLENSCPQSHWHSKTFENSCPRSHWPSKTLENSCPRSHWPSKTIENSCPRRHWHSRTLENSCPQRHWHPTILETSCPRSQWHSRTAALRATDSGNQLSSEPPGSANRFKKNNSESLFKTSFGTT